MTEDGPYRQDYSHLPESREITDPVGRLKIELSGNINKIVLGLGVQEALRLTGLSKSDVSKIRVGAVEEISLDRLIGIVADLGYKAEVKVEKEVESLGDLN